MAGVKIGYRQKIHSDVYRITPGTKKKIILIKIYQTASITHQPL
jgi:hypothetical protein